jgi:hypothetical protein
MTPKASRILPRRISSWRPLFIEAEVWALAFLWSLWCQYMIDWENRCQNEGGGAFFVCYWLIWIQYLTGLRTDKRKRALETGLQSLKGLLSGKKKRGIANWTIVRNRVKNWEERKKEGTKNWNTVSVRVKNREERKMALKTGLQYVTDIRTEKKERGHWKLDYSI